MQKLSIFDARQGFFHGFVVPILMISILVVLLGVSVTMMWYQSKKIVGEVIVDDIALLADIIHKIDAKCEIIDFDYQRNIINFLTIKKDGFVGSEVGSMNLVYPENWDGPYVQNNPTMQEKEYEIVRTNAGYFIVPGHGVRLPNGNVVGVDIILDETADIESLARDVNGLQFKGKALAVKLDLKRAQQ